MEKKAGIKERTKKLYYRIFNEDLNAKTRFQLLAVFAAFVVLIVWAVASFTSGGILYRTAKFLSDRDAVAAAVESMGFFAPLAFILLQIIQTVISPIPGNIVGFVGGYIFGFWGILLSSLGCLIGYSIVLGLTRRLGRRFVEKLVSKSLLAKFDYLTKESGLFVFFLIFLIPALPDDVVMYIAGLTNLPISQILFLATVGRLPSVAVTNMFGSSINEGNIVQVIILVVFSLLVVGLCVWKRKFILEIVGPRRRALIYKIRRRVKKNIRHFLLKVCKKLKINTDFLSQKSKKKTSEDQSDLKTKK